MKYLVVSDIHGDLTGAEIIVDAKNIHLPDAIICLGDILYHGPRNDLPETYAPKKVIQIMNTFKNEIIAVRGNCEAEVDQMVLDFPCLADYNVIPMTNRKVFASHGHIYSPDHLPPLQKGDLFISGHTHVPVTKLEDSFYIANPGSVSLPKEGHPRTYGLLEETRFTVFTADHKPYLILEME